MYRHDKEPTINHVYLYLKVPYDTTFILWLQVIHRALFPLSKVETNFFRLLHLSDQGALLEK